MSDDTIDTTDEEGTRDAGAPTSGDVPSDASNVVDLSGERAKRKTKAQKLVELFKSFDLRSAKGGALLLLDPSGEVLSVKSKAFIEKVRKAYFAQHYEGIAQRAIEEALAYLDAKVPETDAEAPEAKPEAVQQQQQPSQADLLVQLASTKAELFHDDQDVAFATIILNGRRESLKVRSRMFRAWLDREFYLLFPKGTRRAGKNRRPWRARGSRPE